MANYEAELEADSSSSSSSSEEEEEQGDDEEDHQPEAQRAAIVWMRVTELVETLDAVLAADAPGGDLSAGDLRRFRPFRRNLAALRRWVHRTDPTAAWLRARGLWFPVRDLEVRLAVTNPTAATDRLVAALRRVHAPGTAEHVAAGQVAAMVRAARDELARQVA